MSHIDVGTLTALREGVDAPTGCLPHKDNDAKSLDVRFETLVKEDNE